MVPYVDFAFGLIFIIVNTGRSQGLRLLELKSPTVADPRNDLDLGCEFDMGAEDLYSVKWYKDDQEFFRFTPAQRPRFMSFPVAGVHLASSGTVCNMYQCSVRLYGLTTQHSSGSYKCEISTEAPTFRIVYETVNVTVAALGNHEPRVVGVAGSYRPGDLVYANCTSAPSDPPSILTWQINGKTAPAITMSQLRTSRPDKYGLVKRSMVLRFQVERHHFVGSPPKMELMCTASTLTIPSPPKSTTIICTLHDPHQSQLSKLEWQNKAASAIPRGLNVCIAIFLLVFTRL